MQKTLILVLLLTQVVLWADVRLVENGVSCSVIVLGKRPTKSAQLGAMELQHHISLLTGAELPIVDEPVKGKTSILLGGQEAFSGECSVIDASSGDTLRLYGKDSPLYDKVDYRRPETYPSYQFNYNGTLFAVYDFLEQCCGFRFCGIGERNTSFAPCRDLSVPKMRREHHPSLDAFREVYAHSGPSVSADRRRDVALWRLRWRMCSFYGQTNHNMYSPYYYFYKRSALKYPAMVFRESHPEYFARGFSKGVGDARLKRNFPGDTMIPPQLCYSSQGVVEWLAEEAAIYSRGHNRRGGWNNKDCTILDETLPLLPRMEGKPYFYPLEGADNGRFCQCDECRKLYSDSDDVSRLKFNFISRIAKRAGELEPGAGIATLAYIRSLGYPEGVELSPNLSVQLCLTVYSWWHPEARRLQEGAYRKWIEREASRRPLTLWLYLFGSWWDSSHHFGGYKPFPIFYPWRTGELMAGFIKDGVHGVFIETEMAHSPLESYVAMRLAYDRTQSPEQLIHDYFMNYYGKAGEAMEAFHKEIEDAFWRPENCPREWLSKPGELYGPYGKKHPYWGTGLLSPDVNWSLGTEARMARLGALLNRAKALADTTIAKERVTRFEEENWKVALQGRAEWLKQPTVNDKSVTWPVVMTERDFSYEGGSHPVEDSKAVDGKAGCQDASKGWTMKCFVRNPALPGDRKVSISFRTDAADGEFTVGIYDKYNRKPIASKRIRAKEYSGAEYRQIVFPTVNLRKDCYIYFGGLSAKGTSAHYYVDEISFHALGQEESPK